MRTILIEIVQHIHLIESRGDKARYLHLYCKIYLPFSARQLADVTYYTVVELITPPSPAS